MDKGTHDNWTEEEKKLLGTDTDKAIADKIGKTRLEVKNKRSYLGISPFRGYTKKGMKPWKESEITLLGTDTDRAIADILGRTPDSVTKKRRELGISSARNTGPKKQPKTLNLWRKLESATQPDFYNEIKEIWDSQHAEKLTHKKLSEVTMWSVSRIQKWFTPGSAQQPLPKPTRYHIFICVAVIGGTPDEIGN